MVAYDVDLLPTCYLFSHTGQLTLAECDPFCLASRTLSMDGTLCMATMEAHLA